MTEPALLIEAMAELSAGLSHAVGATSPVAHNLLKGELRERRVLAGLRPFIPRRFEISSGIVVNTARESSRQQDMILSDSTRFALFLTAGELGVHPVESVNAVI